METKENKHNHEYTKKLKVLLFASLMFLPLMLLGAKSLVYVFGENKTIVENNGDILQTIQPKEETIEIETYYTNIYYEKVDKIELEEITPITKLELTQEELDSFFQYMNTEQINIYIYYDDDYYNYIDLILYYDDDTETITIENNEIIIEGIATNYNGYTINTFAYEETGNEYISITKKLIKLFTCKKYISQQSKTPTELSINEIANSSIMTWTQNSILYTNVNNAFTGLGVNNLFIVELIIYWLDLTAVYIIIDIVIELFTWLTHILTKGKRLDE